MLIYVLGRFAFFFLCYCAIAQLQSVEAAPSPLSDYRQHSQAESAAAARAADDHASLVNSQPTRRDGDLAAVKADRAAEVAQAWLDRLETDLASKGSWQSDQSSAKTAILAAVDSINDAATAARINGAFWGGDIQVANNDAADNCVRAASLARRAAAGESCWKDAMSAAAAYKQAGDAAMRNGMPVAAHVNFAASIVAEIASKMVAARVGVGLVVNPALEFDITIVPARSALKLV